jgi:hypothetical protein
VWKAELGKGGAYGPSGEGSVEGGMDMRHISAAQTKRTEEGRLDRTDNIESGDQKKVDSFTGRGCSRGAE